MIIIIILIGVFIASRFMEDADNKIIEAAGLILTIITVILLFLSSILMICKPLVYRTMSAKREGIVQTMSKNTLSEIERAGVASKIIEFNQDLEWYKSFNKTFIVGGFISDKFEDMQPIN